MKRNCLVSLKQVLFMCVIHYFGLVAVFDTNSSLPIVIFSYVTIFILLCIINKGLLITIKGLLL